MTSHHARPPDDGDHADRGATPPPPAPDERVPRHLRIDDRPVVRDLDDRQLAAEALAALRAEHQGDGQVAPDDLIPFDPPPAKPDTVPTDPTSGRHRHDDRPPRVVFTPTPPPAPEPPRRVPAARRPRPARAIPLLAALGVVVLVAVLAVVMLAGRDDVPATVGTPPPGSASTSVAPGSTTPGVVQVDAPGPSAPASAGVTPGTDPADVIPDRATDQVVSTPPPAVVSTLSPGDPGFGWPSTAFGRPDG